MKKIFKKIILKLYTIFVYVNYYFYKKRYDKFIFIHPPQSGVNSIDYFFKVNFGLRTYKINNFIDDMKENFINFKKNFQLILDMTKFVDFHKNKVSNSTFPEVSPKENELLNKLTFYDTKLYEQIKKHQ